MARSPTKNPSSKHRMRGFESAFSLMSNQVRHAGESRGFAITRLVTHWPEVVGEDIARATRPVKVGFTRDGMGATLTILVQGAVAPMIEMQKDCIRDRVNAVYGYNAISRIALTQTAAVGFAEGQAQFTTDAKVEKPVDPEVAAQAAEVADGVADEGLKAALERLAQNILTRSAKK